MRGLNYQAADPWRTLRARLARTALVLGFAPMLIQVVTSLFLAHALLVSANSAATSFAGLPTWLQLFVVTFLWLICSSITLLRGILYSFPGVIPPERRLLGRWELAIGLLAFSLPISIPLGELALALRANHYIFILRTPW